MSLLRTRLLRLVFPSVRHRIFFSECLFYVLLRRLDREIGQIDAVGTHVGDESVLIEILGDGHGLAHSVSELRRRFLLEGGGGEGGSWHPERVLLLDILHDEIGDEWYLVAQIPVLILLRGDICNSDP